MRSKIIVIMTVVLVLTVMIVSYMVYNQISSRIAPLGTVLTKEQIEHDLKQLGAGETGINIMYFQSVKDLNSRKKEMLQLNDESKIITILITNNKSFTEPFEVRYGMRVYLYLMERKPTYPTDALVLGFSEKWVMDDNEVIIKRADFEKLYEELGITENMDREKAVHLLAQAWMQMYNYDRRDLEK